MFFITSKLYDLYLYLTLVPCGMLSWDKQTFPYLFLKNSRAVMRSPLDLRFKSRVGQI